MKCKLFIIKYKYGFSLETKYKNANKELDNYQKLELSMIDKIVLGIQRPQSRINTIVRSSSMPTNFSFKEMESLN